MTEIAYFTSDVFTDTPFGGNPLAVFPDARAVPDELRQRIAGELNLSETVFVYPPRNGGTRSVRIFTPAIELPFAGHPTVGTAVLLAETGALGPIGDRIDIVLEELAGPVPVTIVRKGDRFEATLTAPRTPERLDLTLDRTALARIIGLPVDALARQVDPDAYTAGVPWTFIPVRDQAALAAARIDVAAWRELMADTVPHHVYVIAMDDWATGTEIRARMFAPAMNIPEDPATGAAAAALQGYLVDRQKIASGTASWTVRQGVEMGRPSTLLLSSDVVDGRITATRVGGGAVTMSRGTFRLPVAAALETA